SSGCSGPWRCRQAWPSRQCKSTWRVLRSDRGAKILVEEGENLRPAIRRLLGPVSGAGGVEERVARAVVAGEFAILDDLLQHRFGAVDLVTVRIFVIVAEQAEQRNAELVGKIDRRHRALGVERLGIVDHDVAAPAIDAGLEVAGLARDQEGMASAGAEADH